MDTLKIREIRGMDSNAMLKLLMSQKNIYGRLGSELKNTDGGFMFQQIKEVVEDNYDLGKLVEAFEILGGYTSRAFRITLEKDGALKDWFYRKYMKVKPEAEVLFEHRLLLHSRNNGFNRTAVPVETKDGKTFVSRIQGEGDYRRQHYFTVYEYFHGDDTYDWVYNEMPRATYIDVAEMFAELHSSVSDFDTQGLNGEEPPILEFVKEFPEKWRFYIEEFDKAGTKNIFTDYIQSEFDYLLSIMEDINIDGKDLNMFPFIPIQCDLHPGNLKFSDDKCIGIFDFEAAKIDMRLFDICLGAANFFASWVPGREGHIYLDRMEGFLRAYDDRLRKLGGGLPPLTCEEKKYIREALQLSNLYMIQWCLRVYHSDIDSNPYEFFFYLNHLIGCVRWIEENKNELSKIRN